MKNGTSNVDRRSLGCVKMLFHFTALTSLSYTRHLRSTVRMAEAKVTPNLRTLNYQGSNIMFIQAECESGIAVPT